MASVEHKNLQFSLNYSYVSDLHFFVLRNAPRIEQKTSAFYRSSKQSAAITSCRQPRRRRHVMPTAETPPLRHADSRTTTWPKTFTSPGAQGQKVATLYSHNRPERARRWQRRTHHSVDVMQKRVMGWGRPGDLSGKSLTMRLYGQKQTSLTYDAR